ncbi:anti-sigma E factor [Photobacterium swingsii]|uniref:Anti-sigma-E factor RseA n=1 Tax=Photobacterium swingsii TaxID=680026 RepID=A0A0J8XU33_9GAMM|nr:RseA family anti-sigma factor [Photobacterium swingsii]KMV28864.1 anti-sigma E factor [Photobacterium swingsii]PSW21634.1 anti-sigma E factor [Photobacterium swingsii]
MADKEKISALLDGEDLDQSIINALTVDTESEQAWQDFNLIGDVMRGDAPQCKEWNIAGSVALALEAEPAHTGAEVTVETPDDIAPVVDLKTVREIPESQPSPREVRRTLPNWLTQFGQVAMAAGVSLAVIVGVQQYNGGDDGAAIDMASDSQLSVLPTVPFAGTAEPVSLTRDSVRTAHNNGPSEAQIMEQRRRINAMLQDYELQLRLNAEDGSIDRSLLNAQ